MRAPEPPDQAMRDDMDEIELPSWIPEGDQGTSRDTDDVGGIADDAGETAVEPRFPAPAVIGPAAPGVTMSYSAAFAVMGSGTHQHGVRGQPMAEAVGGTAGRGEPADLELLESVLRRAEGVRHVPQ